MSIKKVFALIILFSLNFNSIQAIEPDVFVQSTVNRASEILANETSKEKKINQLKLVAKETVDIKGIGLYTLGSKRKTISENLEKNTTAENLLIFKLFITDFFNFLTLIVS